MVDFRLWLLLVGECKRDRSGGMQTGNANGMQTGNANGECKRGMQTEMQWERKRGMQTGNANGGEVREKCKRGGNANGGECKRGGMQVTVYFPAPSVGKPMG